MSLVFQNMVSCLACSGMFSMFWHVQSLIKACSRSLNMINMQALLGPSSTDWQVWRGTTTRGGNVIAELGQEMAAVCGTPASGPWIGQSMIKLWFWACSSHVLIMYSKCLVHVHSVFRSTKEYALQVSILEETNFCMQHSYQHCADRVLAKCEASRSGVASLQILNLKSA